MYKVIDVSSYQKKDSIDFDMIKNSDVHGVIARAGYGNTIAQKDTNFDYFISKAKQAGHKVGAYWFCYARNENEAVQEAKTFYEILKGKDIDYPVVYDIEGDTVRYMKDNGITPTRELISNIAVAFCDTMQNYGYNTMLYSNRSFFEQYFDNRLTKYPLWIAVYADNPDLQKQYKLNGWEVYGWQYTSTYSNIVGAPEHIDVSVFYDDVKERQGGTMTKKQAQIYVQTCFTEYLGRPADKEALEAYSNAIIDRSESDDLSDVDRTLQASDEYKRNFIIKAYNVHLGRNPESEETIQAKMTYPRLRDIMADILESEEYKNINK